MEAFNLRRFLTRLSFAVILIFSFLYYNESFQNKLNSNTIEPYEYIIYISFWYFTLLSFLNIFTFWKYFQLIYFAFYIPLFIILFINPLSESFRRMFMGLIIVLLSMALLFLNLIPKYTSLEIKLATQLYFIITSTIIIYSTIGDILSAKFSRFYSYDEDIEVQERYKDIFNQEKFTYFIYILAFLCLILFSFYELNGIQLSETTKEFKSALLPSFATFLAWDRLIAKKDLIKTEVISTRILRDFINNFPKSPEQQDKKDDNIQ